MFKKKLVIKVVLSFLALGLVCLSLYSLKKSFRPEFDGIIIVEIVDVDGIVIKEKEIAFLEGELLVDLISNNFENVTYNDGMIMSIESFNTPIDWSKFISIYVDGEMSMVGLADVIFEDGTKISFIITEFDPNAWS